MRWRGAPVPALALATLAALMLPCALLGLLQRDWDAAQAFSQSAGLCFIASIGLGLALRGPRARAASTARDEILTVIAFFAALPVAAAIPVWMLAPILGALGAYFEMVSTLTTTGATALSDLSAAPDALHLWRALTAWYGGFATLIAATAVFAPRNLGGYEVEIEDRLGPVGRLRDQPAWAGGHERAAGAEARLNHAFAAIAPVYLSLSIGLAILFATTGQAPLDALVHAAGVMSTSGVSVDGRTLGRLRRGGDRLRRHGAGGLAPCLRARRARAAPAPLRP
jgi:trk system potassium uptake protein TrkH